jgi:hypothetical protein
MQDALHSEKVAVERKLFFFDLKENQRGRFLRITEDVNGRRNAIVVPVAGLEDFHRVLGVIIDRDKQLGGSPESHPPPPPA